MKNKIFLIFLMLFIGTSVFAAQAQKGVHEPGTGLENPELKQEQQGNNTPQVQQVQNEVQNQVQNKGEETQLRQQETTMESEGNQLKETVKNLLTLKDYTGSEFGEQVSQFAQQFNNSSEKIAQAEEKIQKRSGFARFFLGGDKTAAKEINNQIQSNNQNLEQLRLQLENCDCEEPIRALVQEQIQTMEQEQLRLQELVQGEVKSNGIFGWIFNLFGN